MSPQGIISIQGLRFSYNGLEQPILHDLRLEIPAAAVTAILGPNGSGKTTLLSLLLGMLSPQEGTILIKGRRRERCAHRDMSQLMGLVPQNEYFPLGFSVFDYVLLGRAPYLGVLDRPGEEDRAAAWEALAKTGLLDLSDRQVPSLSGGERQLATVARALAQDPSILLLDEPTSHLDLSNKRRILGLTRDLAGEGVTVILTTHDPNAAAAVADQVVLMRRGGTVAAGPAATTLNAENLSATYGLPVEVTHVRGRPVILAL